jgi:enhancing lycopene biosynthesis protein 2
VIFELTDKPNIYVHVRCTIGHDEDTAKLIETMGGTHQRADVHEIVVDAINRVITTPA